MSEIEELAMKWFRMKQRLDRIRNIEHANDICRNCEGWGETNDGDICHACDGSGTRLGHQIDSLTDQVDDVQKALEAACARVTDDAKIEWHEAETEPDLTDYLED